jgi:vacuolar iron transporter family protein
MHVHSEEHFESSHAVKDVVIGMADGLTVPFALAAGLSGAVADNWIIVTAGLAEIVAGSIAMGLGGYMAGKTEVDHYQSELRREYEEVERVPERELAEVKDVLIEYGVSSSSADIVANELSNDKHKWVDFMMKFELGLEQPHPKRAAQSARNISLSYVAGGLVPLMAYVFTTTPVEGLIYSSLITIAALFVFGYFKSKVTGQPVWTGALRTTMIGVIAAGCAYLIATLITEAGN